MAAKLTEGCVMWREKGSAEGHEQPWSSPGSSWASKRPWWLSLVFLMQQKETRIFDWGLLYPDSSHPLPSPDPHNDLEASQSRCCSILLPPHSSLSLLDSSDRYVTYSFLEPL